jgi:hypothetical protein
MRGAALTVRVRHGSTKDEPVEAFDRRKGGGAMRYAALLVFILGGLFGFAFVSSADAAPLKVTGCLEKGHEAGEFELTHASGGDAESYELLPGKVDLKSHVGHKVEITGEKASEAEEHAGKKKGEEKEAAHEHLKVTSMKHIDAKCP